MKNQGKMCNVEWQSAIELLFYGLRALSKGFPNKNSLLGFGSIVVFVTGVVRPFLKPKIEFSTRWFSFPLLVDILSDS